MKRTAKGANPARRQSKGLFREYQVVFSEGICRGMTEVRVGWVYGVDR